MPRRKNKLFRQYRTAVCFNGAPPPFPVIPGFYPRLNTNGRGYTYTPDIHRARFLLPPFRRPPRIHTSAARRASARPPTVSRRLSSFRSRHRAAPPGYFPPGSYIIFFFLTLIYISFRISRRIRRRRRRRLRASLLLRARSVVLLFRPAPPRPGFAERCPGGARVSFPPRNGFKSPGGIQFLNRRE